MFKVSHNSVNDTDQFLGLSRILMFIYIYIYNICTYVSHVRSIASVILNGKRACAMQISVDYVHSMYAAFLGCYKTCQMTVVSVLFVCGVFE